MQPTVSSGCPPERPQRKVALHHRSASAKSPRRRRTSKVRCARCCSGRAPDAARRRRSRSSRPRGRPPPAGPRTRPRSGRTHPRRRSGSRRPPPPPPSPTWRTRRPPGSTAPPAGSRTAPSRRSVSFASAPVSTRYTPGSAFAFEVSMRLMRACARSLRSTAACAMPGSTMSSMYWPWPVSKRGSSTRLRFWPMYLPASLRGGSCCRLGGMQPRRECASERSRSFRTLLDHFGGRWTDSTMTGSRYSGTGSGDRLLDLAFVGRAFRSRSSQSPPSASPGVQKPHCRPCLSQNACPAADAARRPAPARRRCGSRSRRPARRSSGRSGWPGRRPAPCRCRRRRARSRRGCRSGRDPRAGRPRAAGAAPPRARARVPFTLRLMGIRAMTSPQRARSRAAARARAVSASTGRACTWGRRDRSRSVARPRLPCWRRR